MIQDIIFSTGNLVFIIALLPSILSSKKPHWITSLITACVLTSFAVCFGTLGLFYSMIGSSLTALCWWILLYQKVNI